MPLGTARLFGNKLFVLAIVASTSNINLRTVANAAGYVSGNATITINSGVDIWSASTGTAALVPGSWPAGVTVTLVVKGTISGAGGAGGDTQICAYGPGHAGGTALSATGISGFTFKVDNTSGTIQGGGGGGRGGFTVVVPCGCGGPSTVYPGGGGGGGQGHNGGAGGAGDVADGGVNGSAGNTSGPGAGGSGSNGNIAGSNGGAWGTAGAELGTGTGPAGAAGNSVTGNSNITWIATGTRTGPVT